MATLLVFMLTALGAVWVLPTILPSLTQSLSGEQPKAYWYLSRASAFAAFILLWLSMVTGLLISNKLARAWPGGQTAFDLHQYTSLLSLAFVLFHAFILLGDRYIKYTVLQIVVPFDSVNYKQVWVGIGQVTFYVSLVVSLTFYVRRVITQTLWHMIHIVSYLLFITAIVHGVWSGTDSGTGWANMIYWVAVVSTLFFTVYRVIATATMQTSKAD